MHFLFCSRNAIFFLLRISQLPIVQRQYRIKGYFNFRKSMRRELIKKSETNFPHGSVQYGCQHIQYPEGLKSSSLTASRPFVRKERNPITVKGD